MDLADIIVATNGRKKKKNESIADQIVNQTYIDPISYGTDDIAPVKTTTTKKEDDDRTWFSAGDLEDGYDFGDITKSILGTVGDIGVGAVKGVVKIGEGLGDLASYGVAGVADLLGNDDYAEQVRKKAQQNLTDKAFSPIDNFIDKHSFIGEKGDSISEGLGYVGAILATGGLGAAAGLGAAGTTALTSAVAGLSSMGSGMSEAYQGGATDEEALKYGIISGVATAGTELIFGGLGKAVNAVGVSKGLSSLDDALAVKLQSKISSTLGKNLVGYTVKAGAEGTEEVIEGLVTSIGKKMTYMSDEDLVKIIEDEKLLEQFISGAIVSGISQAPGLVKTTDTNRNFITGYTQNEQKVIDKEIENRTKNQEQELGRALSNKEISKIQEEVKSDLEKGYISTDLIESTIGKKLTAEQETEIETQLNELLQQSRMETDPKAQQQIQEQFEVLANQLNTSRNLDLSQDGHLLKSYKEKELRRQNYTYENTDNEKINKLRESASMYMNNTTRTHEMVGTIENLIKDTGRQYEFINTEGLKQAGYNVDGKKINGLVDGDRILLNIDSDAKVLEKVIGHETTHLLEGTAEYQALQDFTMEYAKQIGIYEDSVNKLKQTYKGVDADINAELTADMVGDLLFTDQEYINSLSAKQPNVFQRIYDYIKHIYKKATAGSKEARQLEDLKYKFDQAYKNMKKQTDNNTKYSFLGEEMLASNPEAREALRIAKAMNDEHVKMDTIRQTTRWFRSSDGNWKAEIDDSKAKIIKRLEANQNYYLGDILDHKELYDMQPAYKNIRVITRDWHSHGSYSRSKGVILLNNQVLNNSNEVKSTLLHEIQHATQHAEGWQGGTNLEKAGSWEAYQNNYGEAEAREVQARRNMSYDERMAKTPSTQSKIQYSISDSTTDNQGRTLTKEQQEFFKDSKARDEEGNLLTVYHGTQNGGFTQFKNYSYFTDNNEVARTYSGSLENITKYTFDSGMRTSIGNYEGYINLTNPFEVDLNGSNWDEIDISKINIPNIEELLYEQGISTYEVDGKLCIGTDDIVSLVDELNENGADYDGIILKNIYDNGSKANNNDILSNDYILFDKKQFKTVDNTNPTSNPDIRYSLSEDTKGRKLTEEQIEYFKNETADLVDTNGNLKVVYHTSPESFTVFDNEKLGENTLYSNTAFGHFITTNEAFSKRFADIDNEGKQGQTMELYAKVENPIIHPFKSAIKYGKKQASKITEDYLKATGNEEVIDELRNFVDEGDSASIYDAYMELIQFEDPFEYAADERKILEQAGYDAIEIIEGYERELVEGSNKEDVVSSYAVFDSNQLKSVDNTIPTDNPDINLSLSEQNEIAPIGQRGTYAKDVRLEVEEAISPLQETISNLTEQLNTVVNSIEQIQAPVSQEVVEQQNQEAFNNITEKEMPPSFEDLSNFIDFETNENTGKVESPFDNRDIDEVGNRKVKAYQYENPEVKPYFQAEAQNMMYDLDNTIKGEKIVTQEYNSVTGLYENAEWTGITRQTTEAIAYLKDNYGYSYDQIRKGLNDIIEDNGKENNAVAKRIEFMLDERLREGYTTSDGYPIPANQEYINFLNEKQITEYNRAALEALATDENIPIAENIVPEQARMDVEPNNIQTEQTIPIKENIAQNGNASVESVDNEIRQISRTVQSNPNLSEAELIDLMKKLEDLSNKRNKIMNPSEISELTPEDASTTPDLKSRRIAKGNKESSFYKNATETTKMLNEEAREYISRNDNVKFYQGITNEQSLSEAYDKLQKGGAAETTKWFNKDAKAATATDVAEGWILLKQYQDAGKYDSMVEVAKKMREMGTAAGQTVQAFNIMARLTPEGMVKYAQSELSEAYDRLVQGKTKEWIRANQDKFTLTPQETAFIVNNMQEVQNMPDGYAKKVKLAEIQKMMKDKIPPELGQSIRAYMRISMLLNPKTQVRNVFGNLGITPVNAVADMIASQVDKAIARKTSVRTTGNLDLAQYTKGFKQGVSQSYNDFKKGINTRNMEGNRFEVKEGKSFNDSHAIGKLLNKFDNFNSFLLDAGDRGFYEGAFMNSINNQMILNNTDTVTQEMINIATKEALQRTWQDNNKYTKFVMNIREGLNNIASIKGYGLGDVLIPFAKTPANLTKAIIDYSPVGLVKTITEGNNLKNAIQTGQFTAEMQHQFVQDLGKATAGTMLYVLGLALAKAGMITGSGDDDKDVKNFMKNTMGVNPYSIKIGDVSFTYDWAQPIAAPFAIMGNIAQKSDEGSTLEQAILTSLDVAGNVLFEQSFMESINTVISNNDGIVSGLGEALLELPSRAVPTLAKQLADMVDGTQKQSFVYDDPLQTAFNKVKAKIPGMTEELAPSVNTLGEDIEKYGGDNSLFNVFLNPSTVNKEHINDVAEEIYRLYQETGDKTIMPRQVAYYVNSKGEKIKFTNEQRAELQTLSGTMTEDNIRALMNSNSYDLLSDTEKAAIVTDIVNYSYNKAQSEVIGTELSEAYQSVNGYQDVGGTAADYYLFNNTINNVDKEMKKETAGTMLMDMSITDQQKAYLYTRHYSTEEKANLIIDSEIPYDYFIQYDMQEFVADKDSEGNSISGTRKNKVIEYINELDMNIPQKAILIKATNTFKFNDYNSDIVEYLGGLDIGYNEMTSILAELDMTVKGDMVYWD